MLLFFFSVQANQTVLQQNKNTHKNQLGKVLQVKKVLQDIYQIYSYVKVWCLAKMLAKMLYA